MPEQNLRPVAASVYLERADPYVDPADFPIEPFNHFRIADVAA